MDRVTRRISDLVSRLSSRRRGHRMACTVEYTPHLDGRADPGEVVWTWVPYEDDPNRGKDRPVLIIGRRGDKLRCLPLTSKDHERDASQEASVGRHWLDIGSGPWDTRGRPSEVRLDRLLEIRPHDVRREGAVLDKQKFDLVIQAARPYLSS